MRCRIPACLPGLALLALTSRALAQKDYVAPSRETVFSTTEVRGTHRPEHAIYVENRSTVPITVVGVALYECENVRPSCTPTKMNTRVRPGGRALVLRVGPGSLNMGFRYRFGFSWRPDSTAADAIASMLQRDSAGKGAPAALLYKNLDRDDVRSLAPRIAALRPEPESLFIAPGEVSRMDRIAILALDDSGRVLGRLRWLQWSIPVNGPFDRVPPDRIQGRRTGRSWLLFRLPDEGQQLLPRTVDDVRVPVIVSIPIAPNAPVFTGVALDADSRRPLGCARVALEDTAQNVVATARTDGRGFFTLHAPRAGNYRVGVSTNGWATAYGPAVRADTGEEKQGEYAVSFVEELLADRDTPELEHARPVAVRTVTISARQPATRDKPAEASIGGVSLGGSPSRPILGIVSDAPPMTTWIQFAVDSAGMVDSTSVVIPPDVAPKTRATVMSVMQRVRFTPAKENGRPVCEMLRMRVDVTSR